ncbi:MAG TPA: LuxR C-terminal-related transcriptional regulator [Candidatus Saccharimonadales bacterium]
MNNKRAQQNPNPYDSPAGDAQEWIAQVRAIIEPESQDVAAKAADEFVGAIGAIAVTDPEISFLHSGAETPNMTRMINDALRARRAANSELFGLTPRETEVVEHIAAGRTNKAIGEAIFAAEATVKGYISRILIKLDCSNRAAIVSRINGLI